MISLIYYWIKNHINPVELPKYKWFDKIITYSRLRGNDNYANIKFYATKNWVEIYIEDSADVNFGDSAVDSQNNKKESLIIPKWKVISYEENSKSIYPTGRLIKFVGVSWNDYKRYKEWHNKK